MNGDAGPQQAADREAQPKQTREQCMNFNLRGLRPKNLQRKTQEFLVEHPNATWNYYSTHINQKRCIISGILAFSDC